jgi:hypothetical protein
LTVRVLQRQQSRPEALGRDAGPGRLPDVLGSTGEVTLDLPPESGIAVEKPCEYVIDRHGPTLNAATDIVGLDLGR